MDILIEARPQLERHFGCDVNVELRLARDYESDYGGNLLAMVQSHREADDAIALLDRFWQDWWMDASARPEAWPLYIDVEYASDPENGQ